MRQNDTRLQLIVDQLAQRMEPVWGRRPIVVDGPISNDSDPTQLLRACIAPMKSDPPKALPGILVATAFVLASPKLVHVGERPAGVTACVCLLLRSQPVWWFYDDDVTHAVARACSFWGRQPWQAGCHVVLRFGKDGRLTSYCLACESLPDWRPDAIERN
jgi:hypothetical protein